MAQCRDKCRYALRHYQHRHFSPSTFLLHLFVQFTALPQLQPPSALVLTLHVSRSQSPFRPTLRRKRTATTLPLANTTFGVLNAALQHIHTFPDIYF